MDETFLQKVMEVDRSYQRRRAEAEAVWNGFDEEKRALTSIVEAEFRKAMDDAGLHFPGFFPNQEIKIPIRVSSFKTEYIPEIKRFEIRIQDWGIVKGDKYIPDGGKRGGQCAYLCLEQLNAYDKRFSARIREFSEKFNVDSIHFDCDCGSDHK